MAGIVPQGGCVNTLHGRCAAAGAKAYTVYNHMLLTIILRVMKRIIVIIEHVQVWDVAVERQISIKGLDALRLMRQMSPRDMDKMAADQCYYVPICDHNGGMLNDPLRSKWPKTTIGSQLQMAIFYNGRWVCCRAGA